MTIVLSDGKVANMQIGMAAGGSSGILISDRNGLPGAALIAEPETAPHRLLLFNKGKPFWTTPTGKKRRAVASKKPKSKISKIATD